MGFVDSLRAQGHTVESVCAVLREQGCQVAVRTYRSWRRVQHRVAARTFGDAVVEDRVRALVWTVGPDGNRRMTPEGLYGRRKMTALVRRSLPEASPGSVDRAMRALGLRGVRRSKGIRTTIPGKDGRRAGDLLNRDFTAAAPNRTWVMDFTYVRTWVGFVYVAFILDVFAQKIVAWNADTCKETDLVMTPLGMAIWARDREGHPITPGTLIGHADAGSQYTSIRFTEHLELEGVRPSIGSVGDAYDNALMECVIGLYKTECIQTTVFHAGPYRTINDVEFATAGWVDWYNNRRLHSSLDYQTPAEYETAHYAALNREPHPYESGRKPGAIQCGCRRCRDSRRLHPAKYPPKKTCHLPPKVTRPFRPRPASGLTGYSHKCLEPPQRARRDRCPLAAQPESRCVPGLYR